ncbi:NAD(P)/FAD-dependent oxidoreductase [Gordonia sp. NPDC003376]
MAQQTYYTQGISTPERPPLSGTSSYDAVVIGGGYAGISAATAFARSGMSVIVLEKDRTGAGASGRNGGILLLSEGTHLGEAEDSATVDESLGAAAAELVAFVAESGADVDLRQGTIRLATTRRQAAQLARSSVAGSDSVRAARRFLDSGELREFVASDRYTGGLYEPDNITINPYRLLEALAASAEAQGVVIAEGSAATGIHARRDRVTVVTEAGEVHGRRLVVAAGTGTGRVVPSIGRLLLTGYSQIAVTEPIDERLLDSVLPSWLATSEIVVFSRYFRRLPGNRLLFGIGTLFDSIDGPGLADRIRAELRDTFPALGDAAFESSWEGAIASTVEETPLLERISPTAVATSSNGVLASWNAGRIAAAATDPDYAAYDLLRGNRHATWPPLGAPEALVRRAAAGVFRVRDRL